MTTRRAPRLLVALTALALALVTACETKKPEGGRRLRLATTTSLVDTGLLADLVAAFEKASGYDVQVQAVGSGRALELLREGKIDVALTHAPATELAAVHAGAIARRTPILANAFVIAGPKKHAPVVAGAADIRDALRRVAASGRKFVSRGDGSGTHLREQELWREAGLAAGASFVVTAGTGMAETLVRADEEDAFALADRATFLARRGDLELAILFQGDDELVNVYSVLEPVAAPAINHAGARALVEYLRGPKGRARIGAFGVEKVGEPLFTLVE